MPRITLFLALVFAAALPSRADEASEGNLPAMFPFKIDLVPQENITNIQTWGQPWGDVGAGPMLSVHDGRFFRGEEPYRFFGTNTCLAANFVDHDQAEKLAAALARFGIGVVRLHHMDMRDIWGKNFERTMTEIDPEQLDRLDYLIAQLEKRGIYVNINLHVSRRFDERDGFENADSFPQHCKGVDLFDRRMIDLQKKYARDLLTHVNPYTGRPYTDDPGVAMIEINNENGIIHQWSWGAIDKLAAPYSDELREMWNRWLLRRFSSTERCREAFGMADFPLGENLISPVPDELSGGRSVGGWQLQVAEGAAGSAEAVGEQNDRVVKITPERIGEHPWFPQLLAQGFSLKKGEVYTLSVTLAAERASDLNVHIQRAASDWRSLGLSRTLGVTDEPKTFTFCFLASEDCDSARFSLSGFEEGNSVRVRGLSLVPGGRVGWEPEQKIEEGTVPTPVKGDALLALEPLRREFFAFLIDLETKYWREMYDYITGELGAKSPVTGTQYGYGSYYAQTMMDYRDIHAYWNHPQFPGKAWDRNNWIERNTSMVFSVCGGNLSSMARARVVGKALVASEYDHPYPMYYRAEGNLMVAAAAAFQGWTGVNQFAWSHNAQLDRQVDSPFFDMCCSPTKLAHLPACFAMLVRGDVAAGPIEYAYYRDLGEEEELGRITENSSPYDKGATEEQLWLAFVCASGVRLTDDKTGESAGNSAVKEISDWSQLPERFGRPGGEMRNETGQLRWNPDRAGGCFIVDTPGVKVYIGRTPKESVEYGGLTLTLEQSRLRWGAVSITAAEPPSGGSGDVLAPGRYLIAATGDVRNTGAKYVSPEPDQITTAADYGGADGEAPILCEGLAAVIHLSKISAERVTLCPLDGSGNRTAGIPADEDVDGCSVRLDARHKTIWYELVIR